MCIFPPFSEEQKFVLTDPVYFGNIFRLRRGKGVEDEAVPFVLVYLPVYKQFVSLILT